MHNAAKLSLHAFRSPGAALVATHAQLEELGT